MFYGPAFPQRTLYYDFRKATSAQINLHIQAKMEHYIKVRDVSKDESDDIEELHGNTIHKKQPFKKMKHEVQMSIIPEKKEEFDVSPSIVELDKQRRNARNIEGFRLNGMPQAPP